MSYITDSRHLDSVVQNILAHLMDLDELWREEDAAACAPRGQTDGASPPGPSDPTPSIASVDRKFAHRDRLGSLLLSTARRLEEEVVRFTPRRPSGDCACCGTVAATHGKLCWHCNRYLKSAGYPCDPEIHSQRPVVRMCECGPDCCPRDGDGDTSCPDRAAEGRVHYSDRCAKRMSRLRAREAG